MSRSYRPGIWLLSILMVGAGGNSVLGQENEAPEADTGDETFPRELLGNWNISLGDPAQRTSPCWISIEEENGKLTARFNATVAGIQQFPVEFKDGQISFVCRTRSPGRWVRDVWTGTLKPGRRRDGRAARANTIIEGTARSDDGDVRPWIARRQIIRVDATGTWIIDRLEGLPEAERKLLIKQEGRRVQGRLIDGPRSEALRNSRVRGGELLARVLMRGTGPEPTRFALRATIKGDVLDGAFVDGDKRYAFTARRERQWEAPIELFNGKNLEGWTRKPWDAPDQFYWEVKDGALCTPRRGTDILSERKFKDFKLNLEYKVPRNGNSGVYLRGRYEVQVADDYGRPPHREACGGIYYRIVPAVNACKTHEEWQSFEITLIGMYVTVVHNGQTVIDNQLIEGMTGGALDNNDNDPGPIYLQGDHSAICYRNIQITPAKPPAPPEGLE